jgi:hypothetical protein
MYFLGNVVSPIVLRIHFNVLSMLMVVVERVRVKKSQIAIVPAVHVGVRRAVMVVEIDVMEQKTALLMDV